MSSQSPAVIVRLVGEDVKFVIGNFPAVFPGKPEGTFDRFGTDGPEVNFVAVSRRE